MKKHVCKVCGESIGVNLLSKHLKYNHNMTKYDYIKEYKDEFYFYTSIGKKKIVIKDFNNRCGLCGNGFNMTVDNDHFVRVDRCLTPNCNNRNVLKKFKQFFKNSEQYNIIISFYYNHQKETAFSLQKAIEEYGETEGTYLWKKKKEKCSQSKEGFIRRYGEEEGNRRYNNFREKSKHTKDKYIKELGYEEGLKRWEEYIDSKRKTSRRSIDYWLLKTNYDYPLAKDLQKQYQIRDINYFINKYGETKGVEKYNNRCSKVSRSLTKEGFVENYGSIKGLMMYNEKSKKTSYSGSFIGLCEKFGEIEAIEIIKKRVSYKGGYSNVSVECFNKIIKEFPSLNSMDVFYGENEWFVRCKGDKFYMIDFYVRDLNVIIEFYGDYWHGNPKIFEKDNVLYDKKITVEDIWNRDAERINNIKKALKTDKVYIIWENDYYKNFNKILNNLEEYFGERNS